jgi:hypothetical protein
MVDKPDRLDPTRKVGEEKMPGGPTPQTPEAGSFESYMEKAGQQPGAGKTTGVTPFDLAQSQTPLMQGPTFDSLLSQTKSVQGVLGDINTQLQTKNLKFTSSQRYSLRKKLTDANSHLETANKKMGAEVAPPPTPSGGGIIGKFLDYVSQGQTNLAAAQKQLISLKDQGTNLKPADFLAIQLKLAHAQQEIEYASIMLSQAVKDIQTLFNIQL